MASKLGWIFGLILAALLGPVESAVSLDVQVDQKTETSKFNTVVDQQLKLEFAQFVDQYIPLNKKLILRINRQGGPEYDSDGHQIFMPTEFMHRIEERFQSALDAGESTLDPSVAVADVVLHTALHELAHAVIFDLQLPVVGKEEDVADAFAAVMLIEHFENGDDIALVAAKMFELEDLDIEEFEEDDFTGEHSLDLQRFYQTICYVYGSDPQRHASLLDEYEIDSWRGETCIDEFQNSKRGWDSLLNKALP